jgi:hypothetical protein
MGNDLNADDALESARVRTIDGESTVTLLERVQATRTRLRTVVTQPQVAGSSQPAVLTR